MGDDASVLRRLTPRDATAMYGRDMRDYRPQSEKTRFDRVLQGFAQTRAGGWLFINVLPAVDRPLLRLSGGRLSTGPGQTYVLLHARGAKSGIERTTPLLGTRPGAASLLVGSKAGAPHHPGWFPNVLANPDAALTVDGERRWRGAGVAEARSATGCGPSSATTTRAMRPTRRGRVGA